MPVLTRMAKRRGIAYPLLSDPRSRMIRAFGLLDENYPPGSFAHGVARPTIMVLDAAGVVSHRFAARGYPSRPDVDAVLDALRGGVTN